MKKMYIKKINMAEDLSRKLGISLADAKSRLSRDPKPKKETHTVNIDYQEYSIPFYLTPLKYLK